MDRPELIDRLPGERFRQRLPSVWSPGESDEEEGEGTEEDGEWEAEPVDPEAELDEPTGDDEDGGKLRTVLLGLSVFGTVLAVGAALLRRVLGSDENDEDGEDEEPAVDDEHEGDAEPDEDVAVPTDEGAAALVGFAFLAGVEALRDRLAGPTE